MANPHTRKLLPRDRVVCLRIVVHTDSVCFPGKPSSREIVSRGNSRRPNLEAPRPSNSRGESRSWPPHISSTYRNLEGGNHGLRCAERPGHFSVGRVLTKIPTALLRKLCLTAKWRWFYRNPRCGIYRNPRCGFAAIRGVALPQSEVWLYRKTGGGFTALTPC